jgi:hypothetical protein
MKEVNPNKKYDVNIRTDNKVPLTTSNNISAYPSHIQLITEGVERNRLIDMNRNGSSIVKVNYNFLFSHFNRFFST